MTNNHNTAKEQERAELHRAILQIANDLRETRKKQYAYYRDKFLTFQEKQ